MAEACLTHQRDILTQLVWNKDIFERFPFLRYFHFTIIMPALQIIIIFYEVAVEGAVFSKNFFHHDQYPARDQPLKNFFDKSFAIDGPDKLKRQAKYNNRSVVNFNS